MNSKRRVLINSIGISNLKWCYIFLHLVLLIVILKLLNRQFNQLDHMKTEYYIIASIVIAIVVLSWNRFIVKQPKIDNRSKNLFI